MHNLQFLQELQNFHGAAALATYAAGKPPEAHAQRPGFIEFEHTDGEWSYRDSYAGYLRSCGQEIIYYRGTPVWNCLYGGGMEPERMDSAFAKETFGILKLALCSGDKKAKFQPRGPAELSDGVWQYFCQTNGDITGFIGNERMLHREEVVFRHHFFGGLIVKDK
jgi:hypothetical protein